MSKSMELLVDPFVDSIVKDPRRVDYSVPGLNEQVVERVQHEIDSLVRHKRPRYQVRCQKTLFIASPRAGFGKSHLIGNLFKEFSGKATLVSILPFLDPGTCWKSVLMRVVHELKFPDRFLELSADSYAPSQLELFTHGTLSQIVADHLEAFHDDKQLIEILRGSVEELAHLNTGRTWMAYLRQRFKDKQWIAQVERRLVRNGLNLNTSISTWLKILFGYTYVDDDYGLARACTDWIQGDPVDEETIAQLGIPPADLPRSDLTAGEINVIAKARLIDLCQLAGFYRPFLFCFDQTETYGNHSDLARALGTVITDLTDEAYNQLTLMTVNIDPWEKTVRPHWERANLDRLSLIPPLILEGISRTQGVELAEHRLVRSEKDALTKQGFWGDSQWLNELFSGTHAMGVRDFLKHCSSRWREVAGEHKPPPVVPIDQVFRQYIDKVSAKPRRSEFDRDAFYWVITELAEGLEGVVIDKMKSKNSDNIPRWQYKDKVFVFGFEAGSHWKRWQTIARSALTNGPQTINRIFVCPRTPELPSIPKSTWIQAKDEILKAMQSHLLVLQLDQHQLIRLYAAQELYADAVQGDIDRKVADVAAFLREELSDFWQSILEWKGKRIEEETGKSGKTISTEDVKFPQTVADIVRQRKFLSLEDLMKQLPDNPSREKVLGACGNIVAIKIHETPNMTVVQWQGAK